MADPLSIASGIAGLVAIADTIFSRTYRYAKLVKNAEKDVEELAAGIRSLSGLLHGLALVLHEEETETPERNFRLHHINSCRTTLTKIQKKLDSHDSESMGKAEKTLRKLKWPFSVAETKELVAEVERHKSTINVALSADSLAAILKALSRQSEVADDMRELKTELKSRWAMETHIALGKQRREVLDFFGKIDPASNHKASLELRHPLTGLWVTDGEMFRTWLHTRNSKLWLSGIPGAGKTILAASLIDETMDASSPARAVAYFYCDYKDIEKQNPVNILGSLATQLARQNEKAFEVLEKLFRACHLEDRPFVQPDLPNLVSTLVKVLDCFEDVSVIVDGLDECGDHTSTVVESLSGLASVNEGNIRVLLLSRDIQEIRGLLERDYTHLEIAAHSEDLKLYVAAEIETRQKKHGRGQLKIRSPDLKNHIMTTLVDRAAGMFRWVACQLDYLCELPTDAEKRIALNMLPPTLNTTYERILEGVNRSPPGIRRMVQLTLHWIINCIHPLPIEALCEAVSIKEGDTTLDREAIYDEEDVLSHCTSLIRRNADGDRVELAHFTVQEFLASIEIHSPFAQYSQRRELSTSPLLAKICLTYISLNNFEDVLEEDFDEWEWQQSQYPFREHAVRHWLSYIGDNWEDSDIVALSHDLFSPSKTTYFLSWARDYIFLGNTEIDNDEAIEDHDVVFITATELICTGGVTPLHLAAAVGSSNLCQWLVSDRCYVNQSSRLGTPLHCALARYDGLSIALSNPDWAEELEVITLEEEEEMLKVCHLLIAEGADPSASYRDHFGEEYSCSILALNQAINFSIREDDPLMVMLKAGARLDERFLAAFKALMATDRAFEYLGSKALEAFMDRVKESGQDDRIKDGLLTAALQFQNIYHGLAFNLETCQDSATNEERAEASDQFFRAVRFDQTEAMEQLLQDKRLDLLSLCDNTGRAPLYIAVEYDSAKAAKMLLKLGADPNKLTTQGLSPLHCAMSRGARCEDYIRDLLDHGADTTAVHAGTGSTCWHMAAELNNKVALEVLIAKDEHKAISMAITQNEGLVPLFYAAQYYSSDAVSILLSQASDELLKETPGGLGIVHRVVHMNSIKPLRMLRSKGVSLTQKTVDGRTAFFFIRPYFDPEIIRLLIESGVATSSTIADGTTALHRFVTLVEFSRAIEEEIMDLLEPAELVSLVDTNGHNLLHYALGVKDLQQQLVSYYTRKQYVKWFLGKGFNLDSRDSSDKSCLEVAFDAYMIHPVEGEVRDFIDMVTYLVQSIENLEILEDSFRWVDDSTYRLLPWALSHGSDNLVQVLLSKGVNVDLCCRGMNEFKFPEGDNGFSTIYFASFYGPSMKVFCGILEKSRSLQDLDERGYYLQHIACASGSGVDISHLKALSDAGIDFNQRTASFAGLTPMMVAASAGKRDHVQFLLDHGIEFRTTNYIGWTVIQYAVLSGDIAVLQLFVDLDVDWNLPVNVMSRDDLFSKCNVLHIAALGKYSDILQFILKNSLVTDINCLSGEGLSPMHLAATWGYAANVEALLSVGADIESESLESLRPIHYAIQNGNIDVVRVLLRHRCILGRDARGLTPEIYALRSKNQEILNLLKDCEPQLGEESEEKRNPEQLRSNEIVANRYKSRALADAINDGHLELCQTLVREGVSINQSSERCASCTPVLRALHTKENDIAWYFIREGGSTLGRLCSNILYDDVSYRGMTAVHIACGAGSMKEFLPLLLEKDTEAGRLSFRCPVNPLHIAVASNNIDAVKTILEHTRDKDPLSETNVVGMVDEGSARASLQTDRGDRVDLAESQRSICDIQIDRENLEWDWILCYPIMDPEVPGSVLFTTADLATGSGLHIAAYTNNTSAIALLLDHGATLDLRNADEQTPLHLAASRGHLESLILLLNKGASPLARDSLGMIPAMAASYAGHLDTLDALVKRHAPLSQRDARGWGLLHLAASSYPSIFSYLLYQGLNPYMKCDYGITPIEYALKHSEFWTLLCNFGIDFERIPEVIARMNISRVSAKLFRVLLRRLPRERRSKGVILNWQGDLGRNPLSQAVTCNRPDLLELFIDAGANMEIEGNSVGTPLLHACSFGRLSVAKYLVRAGAEVFATKAGRPLNAVQAARDFPDIVRWFLVEQYTDQRKVTMHSERSTSEKEAMSWSGPRSVEVEINKLYAPIHDASSFTHAVELSALRKRFLGKIVPFATLLD